jgi:hypothetical protein
MAALGTLKNGSLFTLLCSAFGSEPIQAYIEIIDIRLHSRLDECRSGDSGQRR